MRTHAVVLEQLKEDELTNYVCSPKRVAVVSHMLFQLSFFSVVLSYKTEILLSSRRTPV